MHILNFDPELVLTQKSVIMKIKNVSKRIFNEKILDSLEEPIPRPTHPDPPFPPTEDQES
jgi:hypothetical protein